MFFGSFLYSVMKDQGCRSARFHVLLPCAASLQVWNPKLLGFDRPVDSHARQLISLEHSDGHFSVGNRGQEAGLRNAVVIDGSILTHESACLSADGRALCSESRELQQCALAYARRMEMYPTAFYSEVSRGP